MKVLLNTDIDGVIKTLLAMRDLGYTEYDNKGSIVFSMIQGVATGLDVNLEGIYNRMKVSNIVSTVNGNIDQTAKDWLSKDLRNIMDKDRLFEIILDNSEVKPDYIPETHVFSSLSDPAIESIFKGNDDLWWIKASSGAGQIGQALVSSYKELIKHKNNFESSQLTNNLFSKYTNWQIQKHCKSGIGEEHFLRVPFVIINDMVNKEFSMYTLYDNRITPPPTGIQKYYKKYSLKIFSYDKNKDCSTKNYITKKFGHNNWLKLQKNINDMFKDIVNKLNLHKLKTSARKYCFQLGCADIIIGKDFKPIFLEWGFSCGGFPFPLGRHPLYHFSYKCFHRNREDILTKFMDAIFEKTLDRVNKPKDYEYLYKFTKNDLVIKYNYKKGKKTKGKKTKKKKKKTKKKTRKRN